MTASATTFEDEDDENDSPASKLDHDLLALKILAQLHLELRRVTKRQNRPRGHI